MQTITLEAYGPIVLVPCRKLNGHLVPQLTFTIGTKKCLIASYNYFQIC